MARVVPRSGLMILRELEAVLWDETPNVKATMFIITPPGRGGGGGGPIPWV
jgi:hypothetical protein